MIHKGWAHYRLGKGWQYETRCGAFAQKDKGGKARWESVTCPDCISRRGERADRVKTVVRHKEEGTSIQRGSFH